MALGISRTYFGGVLSHQRLTLSVASSSSRLASCSISYLTRPYATASAALTKKNPVTAKGTKHDAHPPPPSSSKKAAAKGPPKKSTSPEMETARQTSEPNPIPAQVADEAASKKTKESKEASADEIEKLKEMERIMAFQHLMPTVDAWGQDVKETLDVIIPLPVHYLSSPVQIWKNAKDNFLNKMKNATALSQLISHNALPHIHPALGWTQQIRQIFQAFGTQSVEPNSLLAPVRQTALDIYAELNEAIANRDEKTIKKYTTSSYQKHAIQLSKKFLPKNSRGRLIWQLHRTISPVQILSLRVTEGYLAPDDPKTGNRLMVHALIKFDTEQSLEMYNERGVPLHKMVTNPNRIVDSEKPKEPWRVPAHRKRVTEYLVLERRMWILGPWQFREQMWPSVNPEEESEPKVSVGKT